MLKIVRLETDEHRDHLRQLLWEYLTWINTRIEREFNLIFDANIDFNETMNNLSKFAPPEGSLLLAVYDSNIVGCAGLRKINDEVGELKRMYVQPSHRRKGIGRALLTAIIEEARQIGYSKIWLDSAGFLKEAHAIYYALGFQKTQAYPQAQIPEEYHQNWLFMEKTLP